MFLLKSFNFVSRTAVGARGLFGEFGGLSWSSIREWEKRSMLSLISTVPHRLEKFLNTIKPNINLGIRGEEVKEKRRDFR
jgi:hypothetical protein